MDILEIILITLQITTTISKRHRDVKSDESDESIENLLYYKDCKRKQKTTTEAPAPAKLVEKRQPDCPCPKMCCSMCCDCGSGFLPPAASVMSRQMQPQMQSPMLEPMTPNLGPMNQPQPRQPPMPFQPGIVQRGKKKKFKPKIGPDGAPMLPPIGGRREFGFTRENFKSLIAQDSDIKKILKDLVRVTMTKVDQKKPRGPPAPVRPSSHTRRNIEIPNMSEDDEEFLED